MVRKYIMIPIEYAEIFLGLVCNYEFKKVVNVMVRYTKIIYVKPIIKLIIEIQIIKVS